jgi:hypothetical protein
MAYAYDAALELRRRQQLPPGNIFQSPSSFPISEMTSIGMMTTPQVLSQGMTVVATGSTANLTLLSFATSEPVIPKTDISVYRIAALRSGGMNIADILSDFPGLTERQVNDAEQYAKDIPYYGKPYPKRTLKHFLRKGSFRRLKQELATIEDASTF